MTAEDYGAIADYALRLLDDPLLPPQHRRLAKFLHFLSNLLVDEEYRSTGEKQAVAALFHHLHRHTPLAGNDAALAKMK